MLQQCRPYDLKGIESDSHSSIHTMLVLVIINVMMNLKPFGPSSSNLCRKLTGQVVVSQWPYLNVGHLCL